MRFLNVIECHFSSYQNTHTLYSVFLFFYFEQSISFGINKILINKLHAAGCDGLVVAM